MLAVSVSTFSLRLRSALGRVPSDQPSDFDRGLRSTWSRDRCNAGPVDG